MPLEDKVTYAHYQHWQKRRLRAVQYADSPVSEEACFGKLASSRLPIQNKCHARASFDSSRDDLGVYWDDDDDDDLLLPSIHPL